MGKAQQLQRNNHNNNNNTTNNNSNKCHNNNNKNNKSSNVTQYTLKPSTSPSSSSASASLPQPTTFTTTAMPCNGKTVTRAPTTTTTRTDSGNGKIRDIDEINVVERDRSKRDERERVVRSAFNYAKSIFYVQHDAYDKCTTQQCNNNNYNNNGNNNKMPKQDDTVKSKMAIATPSPATTSAHVNVVDVDVVDVVDAVENESYASSSMETLSDNVSIWVDGEQHWISGVDAQTTCADLICALLNYQNVEQQQQHEEEEVKQKTTTNNNEGSNLHSSNNKKDNKDEEAKTIVETANNAINQSEIGNTKNEDCKMETPSPSPSPPSPVPPPRPPPPLSTTLTSTSTSTTLIGPPFPPPPPPPTSNSTTAAATAAAAVAVAFPNMSTLLCDYVIVRQYRHCEEYLDGSTKVFDVMPTPGGKECELLLRRLAPSPHITQVSSLLSTDKDSGMGSPVGSARSARFRRRKHKSSSWLAQGNTLHPRLSQRGGTRNCVANERLLKIILAQDETIHRQLTLLREKERQILKIEEEKHRKRERELGKNYLLETYLNGLEEAETAPEELNKADEAYQQRAKATTTTRTTTTATKKYSSRKDKCKHRLQQPQQQQQQQHQRHDKRENSLDVLDIADEDASNAATMGSEMGGTVEDVAMQLLWLEKVYAVNKRLQREEEQMLKLHTKIRKYAVKRAYQTRKEMHEQIEHLDKDLAVKYEQGEQIENCLVGTSEELEGKLRLLEQLCAEEERLLVVEDEREESPNAILQRQCETLPTTNDEVSTSVRVPTEPATTSMSSPLCRTGTPSNELDSTPTPTIVLNATQLSLVSNNNDITTTTNKLPLHDVLHTPADLLHWQQLIAKPADAATITTTTTTITATTRTMVSSTTATTGLPTPTPTPTIHSTYLPHDQQLQTLQQKEQQRQQQRQQSIAPSNYPISKRPHNCDSTIHNGHTISTTGTTTAHTHATSNNININNNNNSHNINNNNNNYCTPQQLIERNTLPALANNTKTVKKQMFGPKSLQQAQQQQQQQQHHHQHTMHFISVAQLPTTTTTAVMTTALTESKALPFSGATGTNHLTSVANTMNDIDITQLGTLV